MASNDADGLLSQDDIDAALATAGSETAGGSPTEAAAPDSSPPSGKLSQADIDAALAEGGAASTSDAPEGVAEAQGESGDSSSEAVAQSADARVDSAGRPFDEVAAAMAAAIESEAGAATPSESSPPPLASQPMEVPELTGAELAGSDLAGQGIDLLRDVQLNVKIELGRSQMLVEDVLQLGAGAVVELDKLAGDPVDVFVNDRLVARGEVLVLNDNFCVRINDIVNQYADDDDD